MEGGREGGNDSLVIEATPGNTHMEGFKGKDKVKVKVKVQW